jgi:hypothetical protein
MQPPNNYQIINHLHNKNLDQKKSSILIISTSCNPLEPANSSHCSLAKVAACILHGMVIREVGGQYFISVSR